MTSKHLYFRLFLEECKRKIWAVALLGLSMFFALPVATAIRLTTQIYISMEDNIQSRLQKAQMMLDFGSSYPLVRILLFWTAIVLGIASFSYLHDKKQVDFYHSFPVRRSLLFGVHMGVGLAIPAAVYLIALLVEFVVLLANGVLPFQMLFFAARGFVGHMLYYALIYSTVVLAMMLTGTRITALLGTAVFFFYFPSVNLLLYAYYQTFFDTFSNWSFPLWSRICARLSPLFVFSMSLSGEGLLLRDGLKALAATAVLSAASVFLYQERPLEGAGKTMVFGWSKGIVKVFLVAAFGMAGAAFFYMIQDKLGWMVFGAVIGVVVSHCVIEVIYHSDFKKLFCHEKTMAVCMTGVLALSLSFYFDLFGYDAYLPREAQVAQACIDFDEDRWVTYEAGEHQGQIYTSSGGWRMLTEGMGTVQDIQALLAIAQEGIRQSDESFVNTDYESYGRVEVAYTLKSGRTVYRKYDMYIDPVLDGADRIYMGEDYKNTLFPGLTLPAKEAGEQTVYRALGEAVQTLQGTEEQREAVIRAYQEEFAAMTLSRRRSEAPIGELLLISREDDERFKNAYDANGNRYERYGWYDGFFYPLYPAFTKTIQALADCGIDVCQTPYALEELQGIQIASYGPFDEATEGMDGTSLGGPGPADSFSGVTEWDPESGPLEEEEEDGWIYGEDTILAETVREEDDPYTVVYTGSEKMEAILQVFADYKSRNKNSMLVTDGHYAVTLYLSNGDEVDGVFIQGKVPAFVVEDLKKVQKGYVRKQEGGER